MITEKLQNSAAQASPPPVVRIGKKRRLFSFDLGAVWDYRELLYFLIWRDIKVRYKQTALGVVWAIFQPLFSMLMFTMVFGKLAKMDSGDVPYPIFSFCGLVVYGLFSRSFTGAASSLVASQQLITKVYFPRLVVPIAGLLAALVDFAIALVLLLGMLLVYGFRPGPSLLALPVFILLTLLAALGIGLWMAALNVKYRDVGHVIPFMMQLLLYASPITYMSSKIPAKWQVVYALNPLVAVVEGFRWSVLGKGSVSLTAMTASVLVITVLLVTGLVYFRRTEQIFADVV